MKKEADGYKIFKRITDVFIYIMLTLFILFCGFEGYAGISEAKYKLLLYVCGGYVIIMSVLLIELIIIGHIKPELVKTCKNMPLTSKLAVIYLLISWLSAIISPFFPDTLIGVSRFEGVVTITLYCLTFIFVGYFGKFTKQKIYVFGVTVTLFSVISILQLQGLNPLTLYPDGYNFYDAYKSYGGEFLGTIGNTDTVAAFLCIAIPMLFYAVLSLEDKKKFLLILPLILSTYVLIKMWVLAGILGVSAGIIISLLLVSDISKSKKKIIAIVLLFILLIGLAGVYFSDAENGFVFELKEIMHGNFDDSFGSGRIYIWKNVLEKIPENIFFGTGPDTMQKTNIKPFVRYDKELDLSIVGQIDVAHNEYLNILFHQGIFALIAYILLIVAVLKNALNCVNKYKKILLCSLICYLIQAFFGFGSCAVSPMFWIIMGFMISDRNIKEDINE